MDGLPIKMDDFGGTTIFGNSHIDVHPVIYSNSPRSNGGFCHWHLDTAKFHTLQQLLSWDSLLDGFPRLSLLRISYI